jgi:hypothetical protein
VHLVRIEGRGHLVEAALVDLAPPVGAVEGSGFDVADQRTDVADLRGAEAAPVFLLDPEQAGQAALVHQFPGGGRLRFLDIEVLEPLVQMVHGLLGRDGGQEGQRGDELGVLDGRRGDQVREPVAGLGPRRTSAPSRSPSSSTAPTYMCCPVQVKAARAPLSELRFAG